MNSNKQSPQNLDALGGGLGNSLLSWFQNKRSPRTPQQPAGSGPAPASYQPLDQGARQQMLQAMLMRARGGQAGGAPNAPLPAPNSQIPQ